MREVLSSSMSSLVSTKKNQGDNGKNRILQDRNKLENVLLLVTSISLQPSNYLTISEAQTNGDRICLSLRLCIYAFLFGAVDSELVSFKRL